MRSDVSGVPLLKGTADLLVLKALSSGPRHGFGIAIWLEAHSGGALGLDDSAMYQVLHRLEARGFVDAEWGTTENNRTARYYTLTATGRRQLRAAADSWLRYARSVMAILTLPASATRS
jgi:PadR family transcriptional regulator